MTVGLYAGSFDPVHLGHVALITFSVTERVPMLEEACRHLGNVDVAAGAGLLIDVADIMGADVLVRSAGNEHVDEKQMAYMNGCEGLPTLLVPSDPETAFISSSQVRSLIAVDALDAVATFVPPAVADVVKGL